jgi:hypothetical protein
MHSFNVLDVKYVHSTVLEMGSADSWLVPVTIHPLRLALLYYPDCRQLVRHQFKFDWDLLLVNEHLEVAPFDQWLDHFKELHNLVLSAWYGNSVGLKLIQGRFVPLELHGDIALS